MKQGFKSYKEYYELSKKLMEDSKEVIMGIKVIYDCDRCGEKIKEDFTGYADLNYAIEEIKGLITEKEEWLGLILCKKCKDERKEVKRKVVDYRVSLFNEFYKGVNGEIKDPAAKPYE